MKILCVAKDAAGVRTDVSTIASWGHTVMATDEQDTLKYALTAGWDSFGFDAVVARDPDTLDRYRNIIIARGIRAGSLEQLFNGELLKVRPA